MEVNNLITVYEQLIDAVANTMACIKEEEEFGSLHPFRANGYYYDMTLSSSNDYYYINLLKDHELVASVRVSEYDSIYSIVELFTNIIKFNG